MGTTIPTQLQNKEFGFVKLQGQTKKPFEKGWQDHPYSHEDIAGWIRKGFNYGVAAGYGYLCIIDADHPELVAHLLKTCPKTFIVKTPGKGYHFYFICPEFSKSKIVLQKDGVHYGEILGKGSQAVGAGSIHPEKKLPYEIYSAAPITTISADLVSEILGDYLPIELPHQDCYDTDITKILEVAGINLEAHGKQLQGPHPVHGSTNGKNFSVCQEKNCFFCFRHQVGGGPIHLVALLEELIDCETLRNKGMSKAIFQKAKQIASKKYGIHFKNASPTGPVTLDEKEIAGIESEIKKIPSDTPHTILPAKLDHVLLKLSRVNPAQVDAILKNAIKEHFSLKTSSIATYEKIIKSYIKQNIQEEPVNILSETEAKEILKDEQPQLLIHPAQDYANGQMYFGVQIADQRFMISSDGKLVNFEDGNKPFSLKHTSLDTTRFSYSGIDAYISKKLHSVPISLFEKISAYLTQYIVFPHQSISNFIVLWVMGTYVFRIFRYYPYVWLNAEKGSGKTHVMEVLAPIAFNGDLIASSTEAVIFRDIENNAGTMFIDEAEKMKKSDREVYGALMGILKAGFHREGAAKRVEKDFKQQFVVKKYSAYSPKFLAGIEELDDVLQDRTIRIHILRKKEDEQVDRFKTSEEVLAIQKSIRDELYIFALTFAKEIAVYYHESEKFIPTGSKHLRNRELDIWEPLFVLAHLVDSSAQLFGEPIGLLNQMLELSKNAYAERNSNNLVENETVKLLSLIGEMIMELKPDMEEQGAVWYQCERVMGYINDKREFGYFEKPNSLTKLLKKIKIESQQRRTDAGKVRFYRINKSDLADLCERYMGKAVQMDSSEPD